MYYEKKVISVLFLVDFLKICCKTELLKARIPPYV